MRKELDIPKLDQKYKNRLLQELTRELYKIRKQIEKMVRKEAKIMKKIKIVNGY